MEGLNDKFNYVHSSSLDERVRVKILSLEGERKKPTPEQLLENSMLKHSGLAQKGLADLVVYAQVFGRRRALGIPRHTEYKHFKTRWNWNEMLTLSVGYSILPKDALLVFNIYDTMGPGQKLIVGGTTIPLFSKNGVFRQGLVDLRVWPNREADSTIPSSTPGKISGNSEDKRHNLAKLGKKHRAGQITKINWLDCNSYRELEREIKNEKNSSEFMYLCVEFPQVTIDDIPHSIIYHEINSSRVHTFRTQPDIITVPDPELLWENPVERKHRMLARPRRSGAFDKDAKPDATTRDHLNSIVFYPLTKALSVEEQDCVWKYRFYLSNQKRALAKFLKCVNWKQQNEVTQAVGLMGIWAPMDVEDALELLGPNFQHPAVRKYAVSRLQQAPDDDILLYLLQLVQALKYENFTTIQEGYKRLVPDREPAYTHSETSAGPSSRRERPASIPEATKRNIPTASGSDELNLLMTLMGRVSMCNELKVDEQAIDVSAGLSNLPVKNKKSKSSAKKTASSAKLQGTFSESNVFNSGSVNASSRVSQKPNVPKIDGELDEVQDLASFLIQRACKNSTLSNYFYWYLYVECEDPDPTIKQNVVVREMYTTVMRTFLHSLSIGDKHMHRRRNNLLLQERFIEHLVKLTKSVLREGTNRKKKVDRLQQLLGDSTAFKYNFVQFSEVMPLPLDPNILVRGIVPSKANVFKSALTPSLLHFVVAGQESDRSKVVTPVTSADSDEQEYVAIFKNGDDLRQDQLILQMIQLMDKLLRSEDLDLKLTPYKVLATSTKHGFVQYIDSVSVAEAVAMDGSIHNYFRKYHPHPDGPFGIAPEIMDTYVRSCAGYCVITYLLGVGDRHLDNLLLTPNGKLFHIDFGYILGRDPKPMPPPMKLSKEMVEAMGGANSEHYQQFRKQCYTAFLHLRRHANLMLNLFSLMVDASVPDIALEPDKAVRKVQEKFRLDLGEEEAVQYIQSLIDSSVSAVMPAIVEQLHKFTQYIRK